MEASDIHVEPEPSRLVVRFRIDGLLQEAATAPASQFPAVASRLKLIAGMNIAENRLPQDGRIHERIGRQELDIRVSTIPTMGGESIVLRLLRKESMQYDLARGGMAEPLRRRFEQLTDLPHGMILVVGPTGSGKTTTLYSVMARLNTPDVKVITIEDPVEYRLERLSQMQVNPKIGLDFANGLRNIVRQDPDIILVGEIRDRDTAEIAIHAALTGHLVFSTLHTNDAAGAISRLLDMGVEGFLIASALAGILSQRLVRKTCTACAGSGQTSAGRCKTCAGTGYKGRTGIFELLAVDDAIRQAINRHASSSEIAEIARQHGMTPIVEDGKAKVAAGITTAVELARAVHE
jgi:type II secretory ATPase GspE/PulE/Tfp pilus assembly ATPase PilB-like protein